MPTPMPSCALLLPAADPTAVCVPTIEGPDSHTLSSILSPFLLILLYSASKLPFSLCISFICCCIFVWGCLVVVVSVVMMVVVTAFYFYFITMVSHSLSWPPTSYVTKDEPRTLDPSMSTDKS